MSSKRVMLIMMMTMMAMMATMMMMMMMMMMINPLTSHKAGGVGAEKDAQYTT